MMFQHSWGLILKKRENCFQILDFAKTNILCEKLFGNRGGVQAQMPTALKTMHFIIKQVMDQFVKESYSSQFKAYFEGLFGALKPSYQILISVCVSPITVHFWWVFIGCQN